jgi:hypothetical protein
MVERAQHVVGRFLYGFGVVGFDVSHVYDGALSVFDM